MRAKLLTVPWKTSSYAGDTRTLNKPEGDFKGVSPGGLTCCID